MCVLYYANQEERKRRTIIPITDFCILSISCIYHLYQIRGQICCVCVQLTRMWNTAPVFQALLYCYMYVQQLQHREARGKTKGQSDTSNKITIGLNLIASWHNIILQWSMCKQRQPSACLIASDRKAGYRSWLTTQAKAVSKTRNSLTLTCANVHISRPSLQSIKSIRKYECLYFFVTCIPALL